MTQEPRGWHREDPHLFVNPASYPGFTESVQDIIGSLLSAGDTTITVTYSDVGNTLTIVVNNIDEKAQDAIGAMAIDTSSIDVTYTDATPELKWDVKALGITNAMLAGSIDESKLETGALDTWTPGISGTGWALGNGTSVGHYYKIGRMVWVQGKIVFGSTSTYSANQPSITGLPHTINSTLIAILELKMLDASASTWYPGFFSGAVSGTSGLLFGNGLFAAPGNIFHNNVSSTTPFTFTTSDELHVVGVYEASS